MKKLALSLLCCSAMVLSPLAVSAESVVETPADATSSTAEAPAEEGYDMAYIVSVEDEFLGLLKDAVVTEAEDLGVGMDILYSANDTSQMLTCIEAAKTDGKDAVLINLNAAEDAEACIEAAGDMKVVFINRVPSDYSVLGENAAAVASDEHFSGKFEGEYLADYFKEKGQTDVTYVLLHGTDGLVHTTLRTEGALQAMESAGLNLTEAAVVEADYDRLAAKDAMDELIPELGEFDCIISNNDAMALGAILALKDAEIDPVPIAITGIDATADAVEAVRSGEMNMTVFQDPNGQARQGIIAAIDMLEGKPFEESEEVAISEESPYVLYVPFVPVTAENIDTFRD